MCAVRPSQTPARRRGKGAAGRPRPSPGAGRARAGRLVERVQNYLYATAALRALIDVSAPYDEFAARFFKYAAEPSSPLSPFSKESSTARDAALAMYGELIDGSAMKIDRELRAQLPELLWLYSLGVILYWVHDTSPGCAKTYYLIDRTVPLAARLVALCRVRLLRSTMRDLITVIEDIRS